MNKLISKVNDIKEVNPYVRTYLGASKGRKEFYKNFRFITRRVCDLGEEMISKN